MEEIVTHAAPSPGVKWQQCGKWAPSHCLGWVSAVWLFFFFQSLVYFVIVSKRKHFQNYDGVELASDLPSQSLDAYLILIRC